MQILKYILNKFFILSQKCYNNFKAVRRGNKYAKPYHIDSYQTCTQEKAISLNEDTCTLLRKTLYKYFFLHLMLIKRRGLASYPSKNRMLLVLQIIQIFCNYIHIFSLRNSPTCKLYQKWQQGQVISPFSKLSNKIN